MAASNAAKDASETDSFSDLQKITETDSVNSPNRNDTAGTPNSSSNEESVSGTYTALTEDAVEPATSYIAWRRDEAVKLRLDNDSSTPISVPTMLVNTAKKYPNHNALAHMDNGKWVFRTYEQYLAEVRQTAKAFIKLGLKPYHAVGILGFNSPEWFLANLGAIFAGGLACGLYTTNSAEACHYVASTSSANVIVVENQAQLSKILSVRDRLPELRAIVQYKGEPSVNDPTVYSWSAFMKLAEDVPDSVLEERISAIRVNKCCTLIYTSGTTGSPKGVMLSHDNLTWTARCTGQFANLPIASEVFISYLPLSHIAAQVLDLYLPITFAITVYFADPDALKGSLAKTLQEVRPTGFLGVPRVWEKIEEKMKAIGKQSSGIRRYIASWARDIGLRGSTSLQKGSAVPFGWTIANAVVFSKVKAQLGLDRCKIMLSGAAPISHDTLRYFASLNIPIMEVYGMSESTGPQSCGLFTAEKTLWQLGSVGKSIPGTLTTLSNQDNDGNGEVCMDGRNVFMGYLDQEEKTREVIDDKFRLHSGDIGMINKDGYIFITGRIKELIITAGAENVAPVPIEDNIRSALPVVSNCMVIGDRKKFLSLLVCLKSEVNADTQEPLDEMARETKEWCLSIGSKATKISEVAGNKDAVVNKAIQAGIDKANELSESRAKKVQKFVILAKDFSVLGGELGPTLKLKRPVVDVQYKAVIDALYDVADGAD